MRQIIEGFSLQKLMFVREKTSFEPKNLFEIENYELYNIFYSKNYSLINFRKNHFENCLFFTKLMPFKRYDCAHK